MIGLAALALAMSDCGSMTRSPVRFVPDVLVTVPVLRVSDILDLRSLPSAVRERIGDIPVVRLSRHGHIRHLRVTALAARVRATVPALGCYLPANLSGVTQVRMQLPADRSALPPREESTGVQPDDVLELVTSVGPVRVARRVTAVQPARPGQRLFVRTGDGGLLSTRFEAAISR